MGDFSAYSDLVSISKALLFNLLSALAAFLGAILVFIIGLQSQDFHFTFIAAGFVYIALSDLIPELHKQKSTLLSLFLLCWDCCYDFLAIVE